MALGLDRYPVSIVRKANICTKELEIKKGVAETHFCKRLSPGSTTTPFFPYP
jgi:hypothetical protein